MTRRQALDPTMRRLARGLLALLNLLNLLALLAFAAFLSPATTAAQEEPAAKIQNGTAAPAAAGEDEEEPLPPGLDDAAPGMRPDPLAFFNEPMFRFNRALDEWALRPIAKGYAFILPAGARHAVRRFLDNTRVVPRIVNNALQLHFRRAGIETARFGINTTVGLLGFFDPAQSWLGLEPARNDFGLTCRSYGLPAGPYLMLPFLGPSTVTDAAGLTVDWFMIPIRWFVPLTASLAVSAGWETLTAVNHRSLNPDEFAEVDRYVIDLYGAVQDFYLQQRERAVEELKTPVDPGGSSPASPDG